MSPQPGADRSERRARVLVVDDEQGLRDVLSILLRREGYDVVLASSLRTGIEALTGAPSPYDLIITDLMMPDGSGLEVLSAAKRRSANTEVIIMTAFSDLDSAVSAFQGGAFEYLPKPFDLPREVELIRRAVEESQREQVAEEGCNHCGALPLATRFAGHAGGQRRPFPHVTAGSTRVLMRARRVGGAARRGRGAPFGSPPPP